MGKFTFSHKKGSNWPKISSFLIKNLAFRGYLVFPKLSEVSYSRRELDVEL